MAKGTWKVTPDVEKYEAALDWFLKRTVITGGEAQKLNERLLTDAFWIGNGLQLAQVQRVFDGISKAVEKGTPLDEFKQSMRDVLRNPAHAETVFRNATQRAYNAARWFQMQEPSVRKFRPYGLYDAILDGRTTVICTVCNKTILPLDHAWWLTHWPPMHHRCRSSVRNLRKAEAERRGITEKIPETDAGKSWGLAPTKAKPPKPDAKKVDPALRKALDKKAANTNATKQRQPKTPKPKPDEKPKLDVAKYLPEYKRYGAAAEAVAHGRAALELGLDLPIATVKKELQRLSTPAAKQMLVAFDLRDLAGSKSLTLRDQAGELDPLLKAAAALAGHLHTLPKRDFVQHIDIADSKEGKAVLDFFSKASGPGVKHPEDWTIKTDPVRAFARRADKLISYNNGHAAILAHEWGHGLEAKNPTLYERARAFLDARTVGEKAESLRDITGRESYDPHEMAKRDKFLHPYMGKQYFNDTELTSMGIEVLVDGYRSWGTLGQVAKQDPEFLFFALGQLKGE